MGVPGLQDASHSLNYIDYVDVILGKEAFTDYFQDKLESFQCSADVAFWVTISATWKEKLYQEFKGPEKSSRSESWK